MDIARRLFVVPLADNNSGKTTMMNALLAQGLGTTSPGQKGARKMVSPNGRRIDSLIFVTSYQEKEKRKFRTVEKALEKNDKDWMDRELVILPSHVSRSETDIDEMISAAHAAGFDVICVAIMRNVRRPASLSKLLGKRWDERWTLWNEDRDRAGERDAQLRALGCDLWTFICKTLC